MKLKKLEVAAFGGINPNSPVVIDFTQSKFITVEGDMGTNKTSLLNSLRVACGQLSKDNKDFVNLESGKIDINFSFVGRDKLTYEVRCTKSSFNLTYEGEAVPEPITKMKDLLGVVGVSPMEIKNRPLKEIVKWLAGYANKNVEEFSKLMDKLKTGIKAARDSRAAANKSAKGLSEYLSSEDLYVKWEESEKRFKKPVNIKDLSERLDGAGKKSDAYIKYELGLKNLKESKSKIVSEIEYFKLKLTEKEKELEQHEQRITSGTKYLADNKGVKNEYDAIKKEYDNAQHEGILYNKWHEIKRKAKDLNDFQAMAEESDAQEKWLLQELKKEQADILPDIKGVELVMEDTHVDGGVMKKEGLYVNGKNTAQLSESEFWKFVLDVWRKYKVKVIVIDNYSSLGSLAVEILEKLAKDGAYILAAEMNREQKTLQINY